MEPQGTLHRMERTSEPGDKIEEWRCPTCGRWMILQLDPWARIVIKPGDPNAFHYGSTSIDIIQINPT